MKYFGFLLFIFGLTEFTHAQRVIEGQVANIGGGVLSAVEVKAKESPAIFTFTDESGNYRIEIPREVNYLLFSYAGMQVKTVKIGEFPTINVKMVPNDYKKLRFGIGSKFGISNFTLLPGQTHYVIIDTVIRLKPVSLDLNVFYKLKKNFELQAVIEDDLNFGTVTKDSIIPDTSGTPYIYLVDEKVILNRISLALMIIYNMKLEKTGNYSAFVGLGPQFQHFSFLNTGTIGARIQFGVNINNYGKTLRAYMALDMASGEFGPDNIYVPGLKYNYFSARIGLSLIF